MESLSQKETRSTKSDNNTAKRIVGVIFGIIEIILAFRLIFKLFGANAQNGFVKAIYNLTQFFVGIFEGIFAKSTIGDQAVFEPATLIAMIIVALAAWIILKLITPRQNSRVEKIETTSSDINRATQQPLQQYPTQQQVPPGAQQQYPTQQQVPPVAQQQYPTQQQVPPVAQQQYPTQQQVPPGTQQPQPPADQTTHENQP